MALLYNCLWTDSLDFSQNLFVFFPFLFLRGEYFLAQLVDSGFAFRGPRASCFSRPGAGQRSPACAVGPQARPLTRSRACPLRLAVLANMAAPSLPAWLALQTRGRTLRAFSTAVSPVTGAPRLSPPTTERTSRHEQPPRRKALPPRTEKMSVDQYWPSVYPVAAPFKQYLFLFEWVIQ